MSETTEQKVKEMLSQIPPAEMPSVLAMLGTFDAMRRSNEAAFGKAMVICSLAIVMEAKEFTTA